MKKVLLVALGIALGLGLIAGGAYLTRVFAPRPALHGLWIDSPRPADDFTLLRDEQPIHLSDFRGTVTLVFFGYTFCPDICPGTLKEIADSLKLLGGDVPTQSVQVLFITTDPDRDSATRADQYAKQFDNRFIGLGGTEEELTLVAARFGIFAKKSTSPGVAGYTVDHTSTVTAIDKAGYIRMVWPAVGLRAEDLAEDLKYLLSR